MPAIRRPFVMAAVMAATFMIAIEATIVSTAMPQIAGQLGDLHLYSWVFSAFLLTQTATTVVFGKLADLFGRKPVLLAGIGIFLVGSILCGLAWSMPSLIAFRLVQGVGAGAIHPITVTVVGDLYTARERGRIAGYTASVWGISSVLGPLAGGLIIQSVSWAWVFWINVPVGLIAAAAFFAFLHEERRTQARSIDGAGAALFTVGIAALMLALTEIGTPGRGLALSASLAVFLVAMVLFVVQEQRARDPMVAFRLWARRPIMTANIATLLAGMAIIGLTTFLPMYVQGVLNRTALVAGFTLTMMVLGWPIGSIFAARSFARFGLRAPLLFGAALLPLGALWFLLLAPGVTPLVAAFGSVVMGLGMGLLTTAAVVLIQDSVGWAERGAATASNIFARNLGSTLGATALGAVLNVSLAHRGGAAGVNADQIQNLLDHPTGSTAEGIVRMALGASLHLTFWAIFAVALATFILATLVPRVTLQSGPREPVVE